MRRVLGLTAILFAAGCATMVNGRYQDVAVASLPADARIAIECDGEQVRDAGSTPAVVQLRRSAQGCRLTLSKPGYEDAAVYFRRVLSTKAVANFGASVTLGLLGAVAAALPVALSDGSPEGAVERVGQSAYDAASGVPYAVDDRTGAGYKHLPERVDVVLVPRP